jgi:hypothetical protein
VDKIDSPSIHTADAARSMARLERAAGWHYTPFLWRILPTALKDPPCELRELILSRYLTRHLPRNKEFKQSMEDALASPSLSVIVPVHDAPEVTRRCLIRLQKYASKAK